MPYFKSNGNVTNKTKEGKTSQKILVANALTFVVLVQRE